MSHDQTTRRHFLKQTALLAGASAGVAGLVRDCLAEPAAKRGSRISYYRDGEIYVTEIGKPEGKPITTGHWDFKPSWSVTGDLLICFRRLRDDPVTAKWRTAIFTIGVDGSGFNQLTAGDLTDFNPTWTRDGNNTPIWNRKNEKTGGYIVMRGKVGDRVGHEVALTDGAFHTWAHSCLKDGRIFVNAAHPKLGWGVYLLSCKDGKTPLYEPVECELTRTGQLHRASVSPSETKICFEYQPGMKFRETGHTLYVADFDPKRRVIANAKAIANEAGKEHWYAYPRWIEGETGVVYHLNKSGKGELYVYRLKDESTTRVSTESTADYRYPHGEAAPC